LTSGAIGRTIRRKEFGHEAVLLPFHTFVHKVLVTAHECGHWDKLERAATFPFKNNAGEDCGDSYDISPLNPLDKVPTLVTDEGQVIFASQAICEYLDSTATARKMYPRLAPCGWTRCGGSRFRTRSSRPPCRW